jgi:DNA-3-methyladenine glycosylase
VLLRAGEVIGDDAGHPASGPARLCRTLGITLGDNGTDLRCGPVTLELADPLPPSAVSTGPRVGLRAAPDTPWRFWLTGEPSVSTYRPAAPRRPRR